METNERYTVTPPEQQTRESSRLAMEASAQTYLTQALDSWVNFARVVMEIRQSKLWQDVSPSWEDYCQNTFGVDASRIRQYAAALPYAEKLAQALPDVSLPEGRLRALHKAVGNAEHPLLAEIYVIGSQVKQAINAPVSEATIYREALEVLEEAHASGMVSVGTGQLPATNDAIHAAVMAGISEAKARQAQHIRDSFGARDGIDGVVYRRDGQLILKTDVNLPNNTIVQIYVMKEGDGQ